MVSGMFYLISLLACFLLTPLCRVDISPQAGERRFEVASVLFLIRVLFVWVCWPFPLPQMLLKHTNLMRKIQVTVFILQVFYFLQLVP